MSRSLIRLISSGFVAGSSPASRTRQAAPTIPFLFRLNYILHFLPVACHAEKLGKMRGAAATVRGREQNEDDVMVKQP
jgi:hypothetical protein